MPKHGGNKKDLRDPVHRYEESDIYSKYILHQYFKSVKSGGKSVDGWSAAKGKVGSVNHILMLSLCYFA